VAAAFDGFVQQQLQVLLHMLLPEATQAASAAAAAVGSSPAAAAAADDVQSGLKCVLGDAESSSRVMSLLRWCVRYRVVAHEAAALAQQQQQQQQQWGMSESVLRLHAAATALQQLHLLSWQQLRTFLAIRLLLQQQEQQQVDNAAAADMVRAAVKYIDAAFSSVADDASVAALIAAAAVSPGDASSTGSSAAVDSSLQQQQVEGYVLAASRSWQGLLSGDEESSLHLPLHRFAAASLRCLINSMTQSHFHTPAAAAAAGSIVGSRDEQQQQQQRELLQQLCVFPLGGVVPSVLCVQAWLVQVGGQLWIRNGDDTLAALRLYYQVRVCVCVCWRGGA
jgi:hypothetical protein